MPLQFFKLPKLDVTFILHSNPSRQSSSSQDSPQSSQPFRNVPLNELARKERSLSTEDPQDIRNFQGKMKRTQQHCLLSPASMAELVLLALALTQVPVFAFCHCLRKLRALSAY